MVIDSSIIVLMSVSILCIFLLVDRVVLRKKAYVDLVTALPNRNAMDQYFKKNKRKQTAILFLDLDQFKAINDSFGHSVGDLVVKEFAKYLMQFETANQKIFRIGGDEFVIIMEVSERKKAEQLAEKLLERLQKPFYINHNVFYITCSIGIAFDENNAISKEELLDIADHAMYTAKDRGKNQYAVCCKEFNNRTFQYEKQEELVSN